MDIPKELSFSIFLMLMLFKTVVSVPVENINESTTVKPTTELSYETLVKTNKTLIELFPYLSTQPYANFTERLKILAKQALANIQVKIRNAVILLHLAQTNEKILAQTSEEKSSLILTLSIRRNLAAARVNINDVEALINSPKTDKKLNDLLATLPDKESMKTFKALAESFKHFVNQQFNDVKAKFVDFENKMYKKIFGI